MTNSNDLRVIKSKRAIEKSFITLLTQKKFEQITIKDICQEALIGRSTFYRYYEDKYLLLKDLVNQYSQKFKILLTQRLTDSTQLELLNQLYLALYQDKESLLCLLNLTDAPYSLTANFTKILEQQIEQHLDHYQFSIPKIFIQQLYAANVLTAIKWSLTNGIAPQISEMMNTILETLITHYATKVAK